MESGKEDGKEEGFTATCWLNMPMSLSSSCTLDTTLADDWCGGVSVSI